MCRPEEAHKARMLWPFDAAAAEEDEGEAVPSAPDLGLVHI